MTKFIDLIYCEGNGLQFLACAPMSAYISAGDIVRIDEKEGFYLVSCQVTVAKDSDTYKFITDALGTPYAVTDKYSHQEIGGIENE
nr:MAG TPA: protein of unknown function (DUF4265) [Caudoviricetes sp.]